MTSLIQHFTSIESNKDAYDTAEDAARSIGAMLRSELPEGIEEFYEGPKGAVPNALTAELRQRLSVIQLHPHKWTSRDLFTVHEVNTHAAAATMTIGELAKRYNQVTQQQSYNNPSLTLNLLMAMLKEVQEHDTLYMGTFRSSADPSLVTKTMSPKEMNECRTSACFSGHVRLNAQLNGLFLFDVTNAAASIVTEDNVILDPSETMAVLLGTPVWFADLMIYNHAMMPSGTDGGDKHVLYGCDFLKVRAEDIIPVLQKLVDGVTPEEMVAPILASLND